MYSQPHTDYNSFTAIAFVRVLIFHMFSHITLRTILKLGSVVKIPFVRGENEAWRGLKNMLTVMELDCQPGSCQSPGPKLLFFLEYLTFPSMPYQTYALTKPCPGVLSLLSLPALGAFSEAPPLLKVPTLSLRPCLLSKLFQGFLHVHLLCDVISLWTNLRVRFSCSRIHDKARVLCYH